MRDEIFGFSRFLLCSCRTFRKVLPSQTIIMMLLKLLFAIFFVKATQARAGNAMSRSLQTNIASHTGIFSAHVASAAEVAAAMVNPSSQRRLEQETITSVKPRRNLRGSNLRATREIGGLMPRDRWVVSTMWKKVV